MNVVLTFLEKNWTRLGLERFGAPSRLSCVIATPRFRASSHLIFFILAEKRSAPILVVKVPRLLGDNDRLDREAANLRATHAARAGGFESIPQVVAYEDYCSHRLLIETAILGRPMSPALVRRQTEMCIETTMTWLLELQLATASRSHYETDWFERLVERPFNHFKDMLSLSAEDERLIDETLAFIGPLRGQNMPLVMEHGDLSHPNVLHSEKSGVGVVDWELAEPQGLPALDFFFFLTYVAFARQRARKNAEYLKAFQQAFFGPNAWARPYVARYSDRLNLSPQALRPLFVLCWSRYVAGLVMRLHDFDGSRRLLDSETVLWLRSNRYYVLWRYAIENVDKVQVARLRP
jgi:aminoglycoside phosphotransferase